MRGNLGIGKNYPMAGGNIGISLQEDFDGPLAMLKRLIIMKRQFFFIRKYGMKKAL